MNKKGPTNVTKTESLGSVRTAQRRAKEACYTTKADSANIGAVQRTAKSRQNSFAVMAIAMIAPARWRNRNRLKADGQNPKIRMSVSVPVGSRRPSGKAIAVRTGKKRSKPQVITILNR